MNEIDNVVPINKYRETLESIRPSEATDADVIELLLSAASHPSVVNDAHRIAVQILQYLPGDDKSDTSSPWHERTGQIAVDVAEISNEDYDIFKQDEVAKAAFSVIQSKSGHYAGNEQIVEAVRALINLRAGIILGRSELTGFKQEKWQEVVRSLGKTATGRNR